MTASATDLYEIVQDQAQTIDALREQVHALEAMAHTDQLTRLPNRHAGVRALEAAASRCHRGGRPLALMMLDVDHFKAINDERGHAGGDEVLRSVAAALQGELRGGDFAARWGGEEFLVISESATREGAVALAHRLRRAVEDTGMATISVGVAMCSGNIEAGLEQADTQLYCAKAAGRNRVGVRQ